MFSGYKRRNTKRVGVRMPKSCSHEDLNMAGRLNVLSGHHRGARATEVGDGNTATDCNV